MSGSADFDPLLVKAGRSLRAVREIHGLTTAQVADSSGVEEPVIVGMEAGEIEVGDETLWSLLETYGIAALDPRSDG